MFSCEFSKIFHSMFFIEHFRKNASEMKLKDGFQSHVNSLDFYDAWS